jgi:hypothetical protein
VRAVALPTGTAARVGIALAALVLVGGLAAGLARGERTQKGNLIVTLDGDLSPAELPRDRVAPVAIRLSGGVTTTDGSTLPRVTEIELRLPRQGVVSTKGLPLCSQRKLRDATRAKALANCRAALVGSGRMRADVLLPNQDPFRVQTDLLVFNGRVAGRRAMLVHGVAAKPPTSAVLPFVFRRGSGRLATLLVAKLPPSLGPWPHFARFEMNLFRRYTYRGRERSYLSASCPTARKFPVNYFTFAQASFSLAGGRRIVTEIVRSCRAR